MHILIFISYNIFQYKNIFTSLPIIIQFWISVIQNHLHCHDKEPWTRWFKQWKFISPHSGGWEAQDQDIGISVCSEGSPCGLQTASFPLSPPVARSWQKASDSLFPPLLISTPVLLDWRTSLMSPFQLNYPLKDLFPKIVILVARSLSQVRKQHNSVPIMFLLNLKCWYSFLW